MLGIDSEICNGDTENMHAVHTHDSTGKLHIESNTDIDIPIGVFFDIWGVHFNETGIFEYRVNETYELVMTIDGVPTTEYDDYLLVDGKEIVNLISTKIQLRCESTFKDCTIWTRVCFLHFDNCNINSVSSAIASF